MPQAIQSDSTEVRQMMTLCAISYAAEGAPHPAMKSAITDELAKEHYATQAQWELIWGPLQTPDLQSDNMLYLARARDTGAVAIVLRGTVFDSFKSWVEDVPTALVPLPWAPDDAGVAVSKEFLLAVEHLTTRPDETTGQTLEAFIAQTDAPRWIVTGHSQGGGLAPILQSWVHSVVPRGTCASVTFAAPSSGNAAFATHVADVLNVVRVINPLDIVPLGYAQMPKIWEKGVPVKSFLSEELIKLAVELWEHRTGLKPADFAQPDVDLITLEQRNDPRPGASYEKRVTAQHNYNSYLWLLGAPQTDVGKPSPLALEEATA